MPQLLKSICSCDDFSEGQCSAHHRENTLQDELIEARNEIAKLSEENAKLRNFISDLENEIEDTAGCEHCACVSCERRG